MNVWLASLKLLRYDVMGGWSVYNDENEKHGSLTFSENIDYLDLCAVRLELECCKSTNGWSV
jgi:hypothetical protein